MCLSPQAWKNEASAAAAARAPAPPTGPLLRVCDRWRMGGRDGELEGVEMNHLYINILKIIIGLASVSGGYYFCNV